MAIFAWVNHTGQLQAVPYGPTNRVEPGPEAQGQPSTFLVGSGSFAVAFDGASATWALLGRSTTVTRSSLDCGQACGYAQIMGPNWNWIDSCIHACGDGLCDEAESCRSCPADCDCSLLVPLVDCVIVLDDGKILASFGYDNRAITGSGVEIGPENQFFPGQPARGQTTYFEPGEHHSVFQVTYGEPELTWTLAGTAVTVAPDARPCSRECASCPTGTSCVDDACRRSCGDGLCDEDCSDCPDDCGCDAPSVCIDKGCCEPPSCGQDGVGLECGTKDACGVHVDCGPCPDGRACQVQDNACLPVCGS
jgi:hypothetical protein